MKPTYEELVIHLRAVTESLNMARLIMSDPETRALAGQIVDDARAVIAKAEGK